MFYGHANKVQVLLTQLRKTERIDAKCLIKNICKCTTRPTAQRRKAANNLWEDQKKLTQFHSVFDVELGTALPVADPGGGSGGSGPLLSDLTLV